MKINYLCHCEHREAISHFFAYCFFLLNRHHNDEKYIEFQYMSYRTHIFKTRTSTFYKVCSCNIIFNAIK